VSILIAASGRLPRAEELELLRYAQCTDQELRLLNEALPRVTFEVDYVSIYDVPYRTVFAPRASPAFLSDIKDPQRAEVREPTASSTE
jgi:hypothetical protein